MSKDSDDQTYNDWADKPFHFVLQWDSGSNIDITDDTGRLVSKAVVANLLQPDQIERKGFLTDHVIGKKIKLTYPSYIISPDEFAGAITLFVFGIFPVQLKVSEVTLDGEPFAWRRESNKYLYG